MVFGVGTKFRLPGEGVLNNVERKGPTKGHYVSGMGEQSGVGTWMFDLDFIYYIEPRLLFLDI